MRTSAKQHRLATVLQDHRAPCRREVSLARLDNVEVVKAMSSSLESLIQGEIMQVPRRDGPKRVKTMKRELTCRLV